MNRKTKKPTGLKIFLLERIFKNRLVKLIIKICLSALAIYVVLKKIDIAATKHILFNSTISWLLPAFLAFNISKIISAFRLKRFFQSIGLYLDSLYNMKLYYVGMFYNLFLPGGIGGDGYKVYLLNKYFSKPVKYLISATLLDRISGLMALCFLALFLFLFVDISFLGPWSYYIVSGLLILSYPLYYIFYRVFFKKFLDTFIRSSLQSSAVQLTQLVCALLILFSLGVSGQIVEYQALFLLSSVVAVLPFTIGGVGARELVFVFGSNYLMIDRNTAVAFSILFFILTAISSFTGIFFETGIKGVNSDTK